MKKYCKSHDSIFVYLQSLKKLVYKYLAATILLREHGIREHQYPESPSLTKRNRNLLATQSHFHIQSQCLSQRIN